MSLTTDNPREEDAQRNAQADSSTEQRNQPRLPYSTAGARTEDSGAIDPATAFRGRHSYLATPFPEDWPALPLLEQGLEEEIYENISKEMLQEVVNLARELVQSYAAYNVNPLSMDYSRLIRAIEFAFKAHLPQRRSTGEPYIIHPLSVALALTDIEVDEDTLVAAMLHDTVEDTGVTIQTIGEIFGSDIAGLVDGVTKLEKMTYTSKEELQAENFRKMFLAMAKDIRVVLIKLADRLHNMRTLGHFNAVKQERISRETLDIYAPLAGRLGVYRWKWELEDLCLRYLDSSAYYELVGAISQRRTERESYLQEVMENLRTAVKEAGIHSDIEGRPKHFYSIYRKMKSKDKHLNEIYDLFACRVVVDTVTDCYAVLGIVHDMYRPMPGRFKDYIAMPKSNGYQSLHTTVIGPRGFPFEVQIRTQSMHRTAEYGVAAHWRYKAKQSGQAASGHRTSEDEDRLNWLRQLLDWQKDMHSSDEYMDALRSGLVDDEVYVFTPKGDVISLPKGSVPIDMAYAIHSGVGNHMFGAKVNGRIVPMIYELQNGDIVEIMTSDKVHGPSRDWLNIVKSSSAKNKINHWFKQEMKDEAISRGREMVDKEIRKDGFVSLQLLRPEYLQPLLKRYSFKAVDDLFAAIGHGASGLSAAKVVPKLRDEYIKSLSEDERTRLGYRIGDHGQVLYNPVNPILVEAQENAQKGIDQPVTVVPKSTDNEFGIVVEGIENCLLSLARCCNPVPGDPIIGFITRGRGVTVHRRDCTNIRHILTSSMDSPENRENASRLIDVHWDSEDSQGLFHVPIVITARDRRHLLGDISNAIAEERVSIISGQMNAVKDVTATLQMTLEVNSQSQFDRVMGRIKAVRDVVDVRRGGV